MSGLGRGCRPRTRLARSLRAQRGLAVAGSLLPPCGRGPEAQLLGKTGLHLVPGGWRHRAWVLLAVVL